MGQKNLLKLSIDIKLPKLYNDAPEKITKPIEHFSLELAERIINGVINIDIQKYQEHNSQVTLQVQIVASNINLANNELQHELVSRLATVSQDYSHVISDFNQNLISNQLTCSFKVVLQAAYKKSVGKSMPFENKRILIAEDNEINAMVFSSFLDEWGCQSIIVSNGSEAIAYLEKSPVDLILMDIYMPVLNGIDATREIRKFNPDIPIIALTASTLESDLVNARSAGTNDLLLKPVSSASLFQVISKYL
jgi:CheY-like chemotaxis protein